MTKWPGCWRPTGLLLLFLAGGGCTTYQPKPLDAESVREGLQPPDMAAVRARALEIQHPILHPVELQAEEGLTPDGAAILAVLLNPSLRAARDQRDLAEAQAQAAGILPNPVLNFDMEVPTGGDREGKVNAYGLGLSWDVASLISHAARVAEGRSRVDAVDMDIAWREWQVAQGAKAAVYELEGLQQQVALFQQLDQRLSRLRSHVDQAVAEGSMTALDANAVRGAEANAHERMLKLEKQAARERLTLLSLMGLPPDTPIRLSEDIDLPVEIELGDSSLHEELEQRWLDLVALRRGYESQEEAVHAAVLEQFPRVSLGPTLNRDTDNVRTTGFGLNIELPIFDRNQGKIAIERATRQQLYDEYLSRIAEARSDVEKIKSGIHFLNEQIAAARETEAQLGSLVREQTKALEQGRTTALACSATWSEFFDTQAGIVGFQGELARAIVALELATGYYSIPGLAGTSTAPSTAGENP